jgi:replicative DNA helicase
MASPSSEASLNHLEKIPPQSREAEMGVLGSMLYEESALVRGLEILKPFYFYDENHQKIFLATQALFEKNQAVDLVTVSEELRKRKQLEELGGARYLTQLTASVPTAVHVEHYAQIVKEKALLRGLISAASQILQESFEPASEVNELVDRSEQLIFEISQYQIEGKFIPLKDVIRTSIETIDQLYQRKEHVTGLSTGTDGADDSSAGT